MITIYIDDIKYDVSKDAILGYVLHEVKHAEFGRSSSTRAPRGLYCGMGVCFECVVMVDSKPGVRSCMTKVHPGMRVKTHS